MKNLRCYTLGGHHYCGFLGVCSASVSVFNWRRGQRYKKVDHVQSICQTKLYGDETKSSAKFL